MRRTRWIAWVCLGLVALAAQAGSDETDGFVGVLLARNSIDLAPDFAAKILRLPVRLGDPVDRNQIVCVLEDEAVRQELAGAQADRDEARAGREEAATRLRMAETEHQRRQSLPEITSRQEIDEAREEVELARVTLQMAEARVKQQDAAVRQLEGKLDQMQLKAPFDGTVAIRYREPGTMAGPDKPVLRLIGGEGHWVRFAVPLEHADSLALKRPVTVRVPSLNVTIGGEIRQISSEIDPASGMIFCEAILQPASSWSGPTLAGRRARVRVTADE